MLYPCQSILYLTSTIHSHSRSVLLSTMPGLLFNWKSGVCDIFGQRIRSQKGALLTYFFKNTDELQLNFAETTSNGTATVSAIVPNFSPTRRTVYLNMQLQSDTLSSTFPIISITWNSSKCMRYFGYVNFAGCSLCSPNEYSLYSSLLPCFSCANLLIGSHCFSILLRKVPISLWSEVDFASYNSLSATLIVIEDGFWPAVSVEKDKKTIIPVVCPFDYCSDRDSSVIIYGLNESDSSMILSNSNILCKRGLFRNPDSPLCGQCLEGYSQWNFECQDCRNGVSSIAVVVFVVEILIWSVLQMILAQGKAEDVTASILVFLTQSLFMYTFPLNVLQNIRNMALFRRFLGNTQGCVFNLDTAQSLALSTFVPLMSVGCIWIFYFFLRSLKWMLGETIRSPKNSTCRDNFSLQFSSRESEKHSNSREANRQMDMSSDFVCFYFCEKSTSISAYVKGTALATSNAFSPMIFSIFLTWNCVPIPVSFIVLLLRFFASIYKEKC